ncbi:hypothetical protein [Absidia glauca]|uniref:Uncharacterized protein n=1 Tax=Absidia glauca TaxID=4829 RepID=A0A168NE77_ABSGL|nr:hypothetical protein [Absidia glauca]
MHTESKRIGKPRQRQYTTDHIRNLLQLSSSDALLLDACGKKTADDVSLILSSTPSINPDLIRDTHLRTPLHIACSRQDDSIEATAIAKILIQHGADVNNGVGDIDGLQPMHMAVLSGNFHCVLLLLEEGATIPASDPFRLTPLLLAKLKLDNLRQAQPTSLLLATSTNDHNDYYKCNNSHRTILDKDDGFKAQEMSDTAKAEYEGLLSITEVLVKHLANKHMTTIGISLRSIPSSSSSSLSSSLSSSSSSPEHHDSNHYGLSPTLFSKDHHDQDHLNETITTLSNQLSTLEMNESSQCPDASQIRDNLNTLIDKIRKLGIQEK